MSDCAKLYVTKDHTGITLLQTLQIVIRDNSIDHYYGLSNITVHLQACIEYMHGTRITVCTFPTG